MIIDEVGMTIDEEDEFWEALTKLWSGISDEDWPNFEVLEDFNEKLKEASGE